MVSVKNLTKSFGKKEVLRGVTFAIKPGELVGLVGPSGGGNSVLLKAIANILPPSSGTVEVADKDANQRQLQIGFSFQEGALFDSLSVIENVAFPLRENLRRNNEPETSEIYDRAYETLCEVGLGEAIHKYPGQLSGGMRRRVGIARALVAHPSVVLLDDPTGGLDPVAASVIMNLISRLHAQYRPTVVLVSHDIRRLLPAIERVLALFAGKITFDGLPSELLSSSPQEVVSFLRTRFDFDAPGLELQ